MLARRSFLAASGAALCALTGCALNSLNLALLGLGPQGEATLSGTLDITADATMQALKRMRIEVTSTSESERVVITGTTRNNHRFTLTLRRNSTAGSENTRMNIVWERAADQQFWFDFLDVMGAS